MNTATTVADYDALVARALHIVNEAPFWQHVCEPTFARLSVSDDVATLTWPQNVPSYGDYYIEPTSVGFPAALLTMEQPAYKAWKKKEEAEYDRKQKAASEAIRRA